MIVELEFYGFEFLVEFVINEDLDPCDYWLKGRNDDDLTEIFCEEFLRDMLAKAERLAEAKLAGGDL